MGVAPGAGTTPVLVTRRMDPNLTHPYRQKDVLDKLASVHSGKVSSYVFQAVVWHHQLKANESMCWQDASAGLVKWSPEVVAFVKQLGTKDLEAATEAYSVDLRKRRA